MRPSMPNAELVRPWLERMDKAGIYSNFGPLTRELEWQLADFLDVAPQRVVTSASGTLALQGALTVLPADNWVVPDYTFPATGLAAGSAGRPFALADVDAETWALDVTHVPKMPGTGLVPVAPFGSEVDLAVWRGWCTVVIDAAASLGTRPQLSTLPAPWCVVFSLHATKVLPAGEGGIAVFGSDSYADSFRAWSNFGFAGSRISGSTATNAKMSEIHAAYALASLSQSDSELSEWATARSSALGASGNAHHWASAPSATGINPYWLIRYPSQADRSQGADRLAASAIGSRNWWQRPLHQMPAFSGMTLHGTGDVAADLCATTLGLPMFRGLTAEQAERIASVAAPPGAAAVSEHDDLRRLPVRP